VDSNDGRWAAAHILVFVARHVDQPHRYFRAAVFDGVFNRAARLERRTSNRRGVGVRYRLVYIASGRRLAVGSVGASPDHAAQLVRHAGDFARPDERDRLRLDRAIDSVNRFIACALAALALLWIVQPMYWRLRPDSAQPSTS